MRDRNDLTGIVLAGGKSSRMGSDKAFLRLGPKRLIDYSLDLMQAITGRVMISANGNGYDDFSVPVIKDNYADIGPLGGVEACLRISETLDNLFIPCDTPFLTVGFWTHLLSFANDFDVVVPVSDDGKVEPLTGYYSRKVLPQIVVQIENGDYKVQNLLKLVRTKCLAVDNQSVLTNFNTPRDLKSWRD